MSLKNKTYCTVFMPLVMAMEGITSVGVHYSSFIVNKIIKTQHDNVYRFQSALKHCSSKMRTILKSDFSIVRGIEFIIGGIPIVFVRSNLYANRTLKHRAHSEPSHYCLNGLLMILSLLGCYRNLWNYSRDFRLLF